MARHDDDAQHRRELWLLGSRLEEKISWVIADNLQFLENHENEQG